MTRCVLPAFFALGLALTALPALAQMARPFPATALRGTLQITEPPEALLNGHAARLAPGARIRGEDNMLQMSGALVGQRLAVHYTIEAGTGLVKDVWVLRADERAVQPWPTSAAEAERWSFDPGAQRWTKR